MVSSSRTRQIMSSSSILSTDARPWTASSKSTINEEANNQTGLNVDAPTCREQQPPPTRTSIKLDTLVVDWDGPDDPENPRNWPTREKWIATAIVSFYTMISPISTSMVAPATDQIGVQFGSSNEVVLALIVTIFVLAYALGPLFLGPCSEIWGRQRVLQACNIFYIIWNLSCGLAKNEAQLIIFRFFAGVGGSAAPMAVGGGVLGDIWRAEERGKAIGIYSLTPLLGPVIGPIAGAWIASRSTWKWVFWSTTIPGAVVQIIGLFLRETYAPILLERKARRIRQSLARDPEKAGIKHVHTVFTNQGRTWKEIFATALTRPFALFFREPISQLVGVYMAFLYGIFYIFLTAIPTIYTGTYGEGTGIAGLHYLALGIGLFGSSVINAAYMDRIYVYLKEKNGDVGVPEYRVPLMVVGALAFPIGLFLGGWAAQDHVHWVVSDIGMIFVGLGLLSFQTMQAYIVDCFTLHAASALAAVSFLRSLAGFGFPLFAPAMYNALGYGKGDSILAVASTVIGWPAPLIFWKYGKTLRAKSKYAHSSS